MRPLMATPRPIAGATRVMGSTSPIAPPVDTGCGRTRGTVPPLTLLSDAIFLYGPALLVLGVIGSKKPTKVSSSLF